MVVILGVLLRVVLLPTQGLKGDIDQFVLWVHGIAVNGLGNAYDQNLSFPAVMAWIWGLLAAIEPAFRTITDSSDPSIRVLMKIPAVVADIGLALLVAYALRARPNWAVIGAAIVMFHPAIIDVSAWWGQYESIYLLTGLAAVVFAINGRNGLAAAALALCVMTKPQALAFVLPFAAWFWAHGGLREIARVAAIGLAVAVVVWLPFIAAGGPLELPAQPGRVPELDLPVPVAQRLERVVAAPDRQGRRVRERPGRASSGRSRSGTSGSC